MFVLCDSCCSVVALWLLLFRVVVLLEMEFGARLKSRYVELVSIDVIVEMGSPGQLVGWKPEWLWVDVKIPLSQSRCVCVVV